MSTDGVQIRVTFRYQNFESTITLLPYISIIDDVFDLDDLNFQLEHCLSEELYQGDRHELRVQDNYGKNGEELYRLTLGSGQSDLTIADLTFKEMCSYITNIQITTPGD